MTEKEKRQEKENIMIKHEFQKSLDDYFAKRVSDFCLMTTNDKVLQALHNLRYNKNTDAYFSENNFNTPTNEI